MNKTYYEILGLPYEATREEIKTRFQLLEKLICLTHEQKVRIEYAFYILTNDISRTSYDATITKKEKQRIENYSKLFSRYIKMFDLLQERTSENVELIFYENGTTIHQKGKLQIVEPFWYVFLNEQVFPFFGDSCGVVLIKDQDHIIYANHYALQEKKNQKVRKITSF